MTAKEFDGVLDRRVNQMRFTLAVKAGEYAQGGDRLHNFKEAAQLKGETPAEALLGMLVKHWVSIQDVVKLKAAGHVVQRAVIDEKVGDAVNYLVLLEALLTE